jgi:hypothetical protein
MIPAANAGGWDVSPNDVKGEVAGVALGHTEKNRPAFPKAKRTLQFCIQNMAQEIEDSEKKVDEEKPAADDDKNLT